MFTNPIVKWFFRHTFALNLITFSMSSTTLVFSNQEATNVQTSAEGSEQLKKLRRVRRMNRPTTSKGRSSSRGSSPSSSRTTSASVTSASNIRDGSPAGRRKTPNAENTPPSSPEKWTTISKKTRKRTSPTKAQGSPPKQSRVQSKPLLKAKSQLPIVNAPSIIEGESRRLARQELGNTDYKDSLLFTNPNNSNKNFKLQWRTNGDSNAGMEHILKRHTREYHDGTGKGTQSMFPQGTTHTDVKNMIQEVVENPKSKASPKPAAPGEELKLNFWQIRGDAKNGTPLVVGYKKAEGANKPLDILQAYPLGRQYEVQVLPYSQRRRRGVLRDQALDLIESGANIIVDQEVQKIKDSPLFQAEVRRNTIHNTTLRALSLDFSNEENQMGAITISWENPPVDPSKQKHFYLYKGLVQCQQKDDEPVFEVQPQKNAITTYFISYSNDELGLHSQKIRSIHTPLPEGPTNGKDSAAIKIGAEKITNLQATILSNDKIRLNWDLFDPKKEIDWNPIEIKWAIFRDGEIIDIAGDTNSFEDDEVELNQVYIYRVVAYLQEEEAWRNQQHAVFYSKPLIVSTERAEDVGQDAFSFHTYLLEQIPSDLNDLNEQPEKYYTSIKNKALSNGIVQNSIITWDSEPVEMLNGLIDVEINGRSLVSPACFDNVRMLWDYLLAMVKEYLKTNQATIYFPDQPIPFSLKKKRQGMIEFQVDDQLITIDEKKCLTAILQGAEQFFTLLNEVSAGQYTLLLEQISNMQIKVKPIAQQQSVAQTTLSARTERISLNRVLLSWVPSNKDVKSYKILLDEKTIIALPACKTSYIHIFQPKEQTGRFLYKLVAYGQNDQIVEICPIAIEIAESYLQIGKIAPLPFEVSWAFQAEDIPLIEHYEIFRNGVSLGITEDTTYTEIAPVVGKYTYEIKALDVYEQPLGIGSIVIEKRVSKQIELSWIFPEPEEDALRMYQYQRYYNGSASTPAAMWDTTIVDTPRAVGKYTYEIKALDFANTNSTIGPLIKEIEIVQADVPVEQQASLVQAISQALVRRTSASEVLLSWIPNSAQSIKSYEVLIDDESLIVLSGNTQQYTHNFEETGHLGKCVYQLIAYDQSDRKLAPYSLEFEIATSYLQVEKITPDVFELQWAFLGEDVDSIEFYNVYRDDTSIMQVSKNTTRLTDTTFLASGTYTYKVEVLDEDGGSLEIQPAIREIVVEKEHYLQAYVHASNIVKLSWEFSEENEARIQVYRISRDGTFIRYVLKGQPKNYTDTLELEPGEYTYTVEARDNSGNVLETKQVVVKIND
jgi:Bacterial EndoU nuclease